MKESEDIQKTEMPAMLTDGGHRAVKTATLPYSGGDVAGPPRRALQRQKSPSWGLAMGSTALRVYLMLLNYTLKKG